VRIGLKGSSDYQIVTDPAILSGTTGPANLIMRLIGPDPDVSGETNINFLRIWAEGYSNASGMFQDSDRFKESWPLAEREEQPHKMKNGETRPYCEYDLDYFNSENHWDDWVASDYYDRVTSIIDEAQKQDVVVLFTLFDGCLKNDDTYGRFNAWHPYRNDQLDNYLPASGGLFPAFYNIFADANNPDVNQLNRLGEIQQAYVTRMTKTLKEYDNVVFEILNEPYRETGHINEAALWHWAVCEWIHAEDPDRVVAYNHFWDEITAAMYQVAGLMNDIGVFTVHASPGGTSPYDSFAWLTQDANGACTQSPPQAATSCVDNGKFVAFDYDDTFGVDAICCARKREPQNNQEKVVIIDTDGDMAPTGVYACDENFLYILDYARLASKGGAGYMNKTYVADFDTGALREEYDDFSTINFDDPQVEGIERVNSALHYAFCSYNNFWYYTDGEFYNSKLQRLSSSDGSQYPQDPYPQNTYTVFLMRRAGTTFKIDIDVFNYGTNDWTNTPGGVQFKVYDKWKQSSYSTAIEADGLADWAQVGSADSAQVSFTYTVPNRSCNITHEYYVVKQGALPDAFGDVLKITYVICVIR